MSGRFAQGSTVTGGLLDGNPLLQLGKPVKDDVDLLTHTNSVGFSKRIGGCVDDEVLAVGEHVPLGRVIAGVIHPIGRFRQRLWIAERNVRLRLHTDDPQADVPTNQEEELSAVRRPMWVAIPPWLDGPAAGKWIPSPETVARKSRYSRRDLSL